MDLFEDLLQRESANNTKDRLEDTTTYRCWLDLVGLSNTDARPHQQVRVLLALVRGLEALDALLKGQAGLEVLHDLVRRDRAAVDVRRPEVGLERLVERVAALSRLPGGLDEDLLHLVGVLALGREEETRAEDDAVCAHREQAGDLRAGRDTAGGDDRRFGESSADGGDKVKEWR